MSLRDDLANVLARDARYSIHAYVFVFEAIEFARKQKRVDSAGKSRNKSKIDRHVTAKELCEGASQLALAQYGLLALGVLAQWGIRTTSDIGNVVYNLIDSGDLEANPSDSRSEFDELFDFDEVLKRSFVVTMDEVA
ncbi:MAG: hypothetical protein SFX72_19625 [Isosphaeraceae bacterium]|nr:hypothetical protein [Isosphaeraceae bacterium]